MTSISRKGAKAQRNTAGKPGTASFPNSVWERISPKLCFGPGGEKKADGDKKSQDSKKDQ